MCTHERFLFLFQFFHRSPWYNRNGYTLKEMSYRQSTHKNSTGFWEVILFVLLSCLILCSVHWSPWCNPEHVWIECLMFNPFPVKGFVLQVSIPLDNSLEKQFKDWEMFIRQRLLYLRRHEKSQFKQDVMWHQIIQWETLMLCDIK